LESTGSHEIARKIRRAKKLDIKIRETKELAADGSISIRSDCRCLRHDGADEILSQGCASHDGRRAVEKNWSGEDI
jgi:hypothetical protein